MGKTRRSFTQGLIAFSMFMVCAAQADVVLYVSPSGSDANAGSIDKPLKTIDKAQQAVRALAKTAPITVYLREGTYHLDAPLTFTPADNGSPTAPITYSAYKNEKVTVSGTKKITGTSWSTHSGNIKVTTIEKNLKFDGLFVNDQQQILARYPNYDSSKKVLNGSSNMTTCQNRINKWTGPTEGPGYIRALHADRWGGNSYIITGTKSKEWVGDNNRGSGMAGNYVMIENNLYELDAPGEWYYRKTTGELFFYPPSGMNLTAAEIELATTEEIIRLAGASPSNPVKHLTFQKLTLNKTHRSLFTKPFDKLLLGDWSIARCGTVFMENAENIRVQHCHFDRIGGNGIFMSGYNKKNVVYNNRFTESGATCVAVVGDTSAVRTPMFNPWVFISALTDTTPGPKGEEYPRDILIENNTMFDFGLFEKQTAGINVSMSARVTIRHNSIFKGPRSAININDGTWGGHLLEYNDCGNVMRETKDHGPFNGWGRDRYWHLSGKPGRKNQTQGRSEGVGIKKYALLDAIETTIIRNNRWSMPDDKEGPFHPGAWNKHGVDLDDGCTNYDVYNNLCINCSVKFREGFYRKLYNNILIDRPLEAHVWYYGCQDSITRNVFVASPKGGRDGAIYNFINCTEFDKNESWFDNNFWSVSGARGPTATLKAGLDKNSKSGDPQFADPASLDYTVNSSVALSLGFKNFPMDNFGPREVSTAIKGNGVAKPLPAASGVRTTWSGNRIVTHFALDRKSPVTVTLFTADGRKIAEIFEGLRGAGAHTLSWTMDSPVASGACLVLFEAGNQRVAKKVVVVR